MYRTKKLQKTIDTYNKIVRPYIANTYHLTPLKEIKRFMRMLEENTPILDAGCGWGRDSKLFVKKGFKVQGIDLSGKLLDKARNYVSEADFFLKDIRDTGMPENVFAGIWANAVLNHLDMADIEKTLNEFKRILKKEGVLFVSVKKGKGQEFKKDHFTENKPRFYNWIQEKTLIALFKKTNFKIIDFYTIYEEERWGLKRNLPILNIFAKK